MKKLRKPLSLLLTLTMVLSLFCGMSTVAHAAALDVKIYDQDGISVSLSREIEPVIKKDVKFTVIIDGTTVLSEMNVSGVALTANNLSVEAEGYTVTYEGEHTTVAAGTLTLNANLDDEYSVIINLASEKKQDTILIADDRTEYGTFHWQKNSADNTAFQRKVTVYVNDVETYTQTVNTPKDLSNGGTNNQCSNIKVTVTKGDSLTRDQIPTGMEPDPGYKKTGSWNTTPNTTRKLNSNVTYTYTFTKSGDTEPEDEDCILYFESNGGTEFKKIDNGNDSFRINPYSDSEYGQHIPSRPGYRFTGWYRDEDLENRISESTKINVNSIMTIYAGWERTSVPSMLNGDDHYAYIQGYADGTVRPNANITRAQVATIFFRLLDEDVRSDYLTTYNTFPDVNADYWANTAISTMASLGVINGRNSGLFDPDAYITRAEFAAICARFDDSNVSGFDSFTDTFGHWAEEEIGRAAALGWIQGYDDGTFRPNQYITRAQAVTMINRVLCRLPEDEDDLLPGMNVWTDCREGDWCYLAIQEATNSHDYVTKDRVYETWTDLNRAPDWSRYE